MPMALILGPMATVLCPTRVSEYNFLLTGPVESVNDFRCLIQRVAEIFLCNGWKEAILYYDDKNFLQPQRFI